MRITVVFSLAYNDKHIFFVMFCLASQDKKLNTNCDLSDVTFLALSTSRHMSH